MEGSIRLFWIQATLHSRNRSVVRHDQAKALGNKRRVLDIDGGALLVRTKRTRTERACGAATGESVDSRNLQ
jgi:hypothetical protein